MQLNKYDKRYKKYLSLWSEWDKLYEEEKKLPWVEVEKPYQDGWILNIEYRDDIKNRSDYGELKDALELVQRNGRTKNPKMVNKIRGNKKLDAVQMLFDPKHLHYAFHDPHAVGDKFSGYNKYWHKGSSNGFPPLLGRLRKSDYDAQPLSIQKWFYKIEETRFYEKVTSYHLNVPKFWLIVKVKPAIVTHIKNIDPIIKQRQAEIDKELDYLRQIGAGKKYSSDKRFSKHWGNSALRCFERAAIQKFMKGETDDFEIKNKIKDYD